MREEIIILPRDLGPSPARAPARQAPAARGAPQPPAARAPKRKSKTKPRKTLTAKGRRALAMDVMASIEPQKMVQPTSPAAAAAAAAAPAPAAAAPPVNPAHIRNRGKAWSKADLSTLARLGEDPAFLRATIPDHPAGMEVDWERISAHFGRYSKGGLAVKQQYHSLVRLMKVGLRAAPRMVDYLLYLYSRCRVFMLPSDAFSSPRLTWRL